MCFVVLGINKSFLFVIIEILSCQNQSLYDLQFFEKIDNFGEYFQKDIKGT